MNLYAKKTWTRCHWECTHHYAFVICIWCGCFSKFTLEDEMRIMSVQENFCRHCKFKCQQLQTKGYACEDLVRINHALCLRMSHLKRHKAFNTLALRFFPICRWNEYITNGLDLRKGPNRQQKTFALEESKYWAPIILKDSSSTLCK